MRLPLVPGPRLSSSIFDDGPSEPPLAFIDNEPFIIELQGSLELPGSGTEGTPGEMNGVSVGRLELDDPYKPVLRIAHHRLEGKLVTLIDPYAILRTVYVPEKDNSSPKSPKRRRLDFGSNLDGPDSQDTQSEPLDRNTEPRQQEITIVGIVRKKIVFSKRPEPIITLSSEADYEVGNVGQ